ncbi:MAG: 1-(5-phosphoribosyl)-5-[(5-phosphoribosylamino)methylideneamino]imidazole-4-carboxamide isomerase [Candidatus Bathyarchaeia archaeon]
MRIFPAIDLMNGKVVRLFKGDPETAKTYDYLGEPVAIAKKWEENGADAIHIVDLDAAFGSGNNIATISEIVKRVNLPLHVGGGIRSIQMAETLLNMGVDNIILGTLAFRKPDVIESIRKKFGDCIIIALDHLNGKVMVEGWRKPVELEVKNALKRFLEFQVKTFLVTSISRDGTFGGVDVDVLRQACACQEARIIAAGGVGSLKDLAVLKQIGVHGVVIGKALYEGIFTLKEALKIVKETET